LTKGARKILVKFSTEREEIVERSILRLYLESQILNVQKRKINIHNFKQGTINLLFLQQVMELPV